MSEPPSGTDCGPDRHDDADQHQKPAETITAVDRVADKPEQTAD
jgi:hypothetical protein